MCMYCCQTEQQWRHNRCGLKTGDLCRLFLLGDNAHKWRWKMNEQGIDFVSLSDRVAIVTYFVLYQVVHSSTSCSNGGYCGCEGDMLGGEEVEQLFVLRRNATTRIDFVQFFCQGMPRNLFLQFVRVCVRRSFCCLVYSLHNQLFYCIVATHKMCP